MDPVIAVVQPEEQLRYARLLDSGTRIGLLVLVVTFTGYVFGVMTPRVPVERLPELWMLSVDAYLEVTRSPTGWTWLTELHRGDMAGLMGIAILAGCSLMALLALVPLYHSRRDRAFAALCLAEVMVISLAASGWLVGGH